jgi:DNA-directed RNA polymerase subunit RPC12/RpoP
VENVLDKPIAHQARVAPYATVVIPLFLSSLTGFRYRTINCMECGAEFIERNNDMLYRLNDDSQPAEIAINGEVTNARCGRCQQSYTVMVSLNVNLDQNGIPMHLQPQSVYIASETVKKLRYLHCMECGKPFHSISDRIRQVVDNRVPFEHLDPNKIGVLEALCHAQSCGQTWALMI